MTIDLRRVRLSGERQLALFFFVGIAAGTVFANQTGVEGYRGITLMSAMPDTKRLWHMVVWQRMLEGTAGWLLGTCIAAFPCFCMIAVGTGFSMGMLISVFTMQKGIGGILTYLAAVFPQYLIYVPVWCILASWAVAKERRIRWAGGAAVLLLILVGTLLEAFVNPWILGIMGKI